MDFNSCSFNIVNGSAILNLNAVKFNGTTKLYWEPTAELNSDLFIIEHSYNGIDWNRIGNVMNNGSAQYEFRDTHPVNGFNYYRLRTINKQGGVIFTNVKSVYYENTNSLSGINVAPNPIGNVLLLNYFSSEEIKTKIKIIDELGRIVSSTESVARKGENMVEVDTRNFSGGLYYITLSSFSLSTNCKMILKAQQQIN